MTTFKVSNGDPLPVADMLGLVKMKTREESRAVAGSLKTLTQSTAGQLRALW